MKNSKLVSAQIPEVNFRNCNINDVEWQPEDYDTHEYEATYFNPKDPELWLHNAPLFTAEQLNNKLPKAKAGYKHPVDRIIINYTPKLANKLRQDGYFDRPDYPRDDTIYADNRYAIRYQINQGESNVTEYGKCPVCLEPIKYGQGMVEAHNRELDDRDFLEGGHFIHNYCFYYKLCPHTNKCPLCREPMVCERDGNVFQIAMSKEMAERAAAHAAELAAEEAEEDNNTSTGGRRTRRRMGKKGTRRRSRRSRSRK